eukprot:1595239-Heterocapsa_arctica.AAC.1
MLWPFSASAASAGRPVATARSRPRAAPSASGVKELAEADASGAAPRTCCCTAWRPASGAAPMGVGITKADAP